MKLWPQLSTVNSARKLSCEIVKPTERRLIKDYVLWIIVEIASYSLGRSSS